MDNMFLIMTDECGDEQYVGGYTLSLNLDEDELEIWQERKLEKAREQYPEARYFYFEDRRYWAVRIAQDMHEWGL